MGYTIGMPSLKLSNIEGKGGKHCGNFAKVAKEALSERLGQDLDIKHELTIFNYYDGCKSAAELQEYSENWIINRNTEIEIYNELIKNINESSDLEKKLNGIITRRSLNRHKEDILQANVQEQLLKLMKREKPDLKEDEELFLSELLGKMANEEETQRDTENGKRAVERIKATLEKNETLKKMRSIRKDAVVMCATLIKPPQEFMATLSPEQQKQFLLDGIEKIKDIVGAENVKSVVIHFDELVTHAHIFWQPVTSDGRLCAKEMHNLQFLGRLNREMPQYLREKGWEKIDDCHAYDAEEEQKLREEMGDKAYREYKQEKRSLQGRDSKTFKGDMDKKVEALSIDIKKKEQHSKKLDSEIESKEQKYKNLQNMISDLEQTLEIAKADTKETKTVKGAFGTSKTVPKTADELLRDKEIVAAKLVLQREAAVASREAKCESREMNLSSQLAHESMQAEERKYKAVERARAEEQDKAEQQLQQLRERCNQTVLEIQEKIRCIQERYYALEKLADDYACLIDNIDIPEELQQLNSDCWERLQALKKHEHIKIPERTEF